MQKKIEWLIKTLVGISFFTPLLLVSSRFIFPFIVPKILFFRGLVLLMLGSYLILLISNWHQYKLKTTSINIAVWIFLLSFGISTFVGVDWYKSFWDNHERMLGLFTIFHFVVYYFIATSIIKEWKEWRWLLRIFLCAGSIVMLIGIIQKFDPEYLLNRGSGRVSATLGNAIYFSAYGLFLFFAGLLLAFKEQNKGWKLYALVGSILGFFGIFGGGTRGTFFGLIAGLAVLLSVYFVTLKGYKKTKLGLTAGIAIIVVFLFVFRQTDFVKRIPLVGQVVNINLRTDLFTGTIGSRLMAWEIAGQSWKEKPIFGWGPNNYYYAFNKYYKAEFLGHGWGETWFDNAHSTLINTLSVQGIVGVLAYLGIFFVPLCILVQSYRKKNIDQHVLAVSLAFLAGHFTHNFFVFENPTSYLYFFFFLALINSQISNPPESRILNVKKESGDVSLGLSLGVGFVTILFIYSTDINPARANMATLNSIQAMYGNPASGEEVYARATSIPSPHIDDIRNDFSRSALQVITAMLQSNRTEEAKKIFTLVDSELQKNRVLHPMDIRVHIQQSQLEDMMAQSTGNISLAIKSEEALSEALTYSPKRQQIQYMLSMIKLQLGKKDEAIKLLQDSIDNFEPIDEGWWRMALTYKESGDEAKALETIKMAKEKGIVFSGQGEKVVSIILNESSKK